MTQQHGTIAPPRVGWIPALQESESEITAWKQFQQEESGLPGTESQKRVWAELVRKQSARGTVLSSFELSEWGEVEHDIASFQFGQPPLETVSSFFGQPPQLKSFWFNVNAELIIYGATEPTAAVTIAGQAIELRPDGSFSVRLAFPDGNYDLEVAAVSVDNELRQAKLKFRRCTEYSEANPTTPC